MTREWKPGDVAVVGGQPALRVDQDGDVFWVSPLGTHWREVTAERPLVVIDPEDREQLIRLGNLIAFCEEQYRGGNYRDYMPLREALREFAAPKPPKCKAALNIKGEHFGCDQPEGHGMTHANTAAGAIWGEGE